MPELQAALDLQAPPPGNTPTLPLHALFTYPSAILLGAIIFSSVE